MTPLCLAIPKLPLAYVQEAVVILDNGIAHIDDFSPDEFDIDPFLEVEIVEGYYGEERRVPAIFFESQGEAVAAVLTLEDYSLIAR